MVHVDEALLKTSIWPYSGPYGLPSWCYRADAWIRSAIRQPIAFENQKSRLIETWRLEIASFRYSLMSDRLPGKHKAATPTIALEGVQPNSEL